MKTRLLTLLAVGITTFLLLEAALFLLVASGTIPIRKPNYSFSEEPFWSDSNARFGVWHKAGVSVRHRKSCFDVVYQANSYGARDAERDLESDTPRVVVLGDSFVEGYGLDVGDRTSNLLEDHAGIEHLNFGSTGHFGPTQFYLVYEWLARDFEHDAVLVGILPDNDFLDDDFDYGRIAYWNRYRPYWTGEYPDYELIYFPQSRAPENPTLARLKHVLSESTYTYNALDIHQRFARRPSCTGAH